MRNEIELDVPGSLDGPIKSGIQSDGGAVLGRIYGHKECGPAPVSNELGVHTANGDHRSVGAHNGGDGVQIEGGVLESRGIIPSIEATCVALQELQIRRKHAIANSVAITNQMTALVARYCGYDANDEATREALYKRAQAIVGGKGKPEDESIVRALAPELKVAEIQLDAADARRKEVEKEMIRLAGTLPVASFVDAIPGFGAKGLAVIVGEAGNLSRFATVRKLWRWLGYGMAPGHEEHAYSTWRKQGGLTKEEWETARYNPKRQPQIFGVVTEPLIKHKSKSKYGQVYADRRARTFETHPEWYLDKNGKQKVDKDGKRTSKHAAMDAGRVMTKALLRDLWVAWRDASPAQL